MPRVVSVLHHPIPPLRPGFIAEEDGLGWHFRSARALAKYGGYDAVAIRPNNTETWVTRIVDGVPVWLVPSMNLSPSKKLWRWSYASPALAEAVKGLVRMGFIPYIHEYRALNSELVIRAVINYPMILQHHGSFPPSRLSLDNPINAIKEFSKLRRDAFLRRVRGFFFVLNKYEEHYLKNVLNVDAEVKIRTMGVDFNEIKPLSPKERLKIREDLGFGNDDVLLSTYVGIFGEEFSGMKGAHYLFRIWRVLRARFDDKVKMVVTGVGEPYLTAMRRVGIVAYRLLPHMDYVKIVGASDAYFLPATSGYKYGGIGVAVMEATALGVPVVSPTLREFPEQDRIKDIGIATDWVDDERSLGRFIDALTYVIENRDSYKPWVIRELGWRYYSWESFVKDFNEAVRKL